MTSKAFYVKQERKSAPVGVCYAVAFVSLVAAVLLCIGVCAWKPVLMAVAVALWAALQVVNWHYSWIGAAKFYAKGNCLVYEYREIVTLSAKPTVCTIVRADRIKRGRRHMWVYGVIAVKEPLRTVRQEKRLKISDCTDEEAFQIIEGYRKTDEVKLP